MQRLYYFDNIKIVLIVFVIFFHAGQTYGPGEAWAVSVSGPLPFANLIIVGTFLAVSASFVMELFLFISAYFLAGSFDRKGGRKFLKDRFVRLGIPLIVIAAIFFSLHPATFTLGYSWFMAALLVLAVVYSAWRRFNLTVRPVPCPGNGALLLAALALGTVNFAVRGWYALSQWELWHAVEPAHVPVYVLFIVAGILAYRNGWLETVSPTLVRTWGIITAIGLCGIPLFIYVLGLTTVQGGFTAASLLYSFWEAFLGIGICTCMLIVFKNRWNTTGHIKALLAKNVYAVYLIQVPIILFLQWRLVQSGLPLLLQFVLVGAIATALCFLISNYIVRKLPYTQRVIF